MSFLTTRRGRARRARATGADVETFRTLRRRAGLSQEEAAKRAGRSVSLVSKLEAGAVESPSYATAEAFAAVFGVAPGDVVAAIRNTRGGV